jgi:hypothetical protein
MHNDIAHQLFINSGVVMREVLWNILIVWTTHETSKADGNVLKMKCKTCLTIYPSKYGLE